MSKKIFAVEGSGYRDMLQSGSGSFYSAHKQEDIEKWLSHMNADSDDYSFNEVFQDNDWWDEESHGNLDEYDVNFREIENASEGEWKYDEEIQKFLDEEPQRNRDAGIQIITYQFNDLMGNVKGMKDTALQLLIDFKKVVKTDDYENLPEEEKNIYWTLKDLISPNHREILLGELPPKSN